MPEAQWDYALLTYRTQNIGDYIQSIAAKRFLPRVDHLAQRDELNRFTPQRLTKLICNGWFGRSPEGLRFHETVLPLVISMYISQHVNLARGGDVTAFAQFLRNVPELKAELARFAPIGARY